MSHEIRTPLNSISGYINIAKNHLENQERLEDCLEKADISARHLLEIVNDVLDFSAMEDGKLVVLNEEFHFDEIVEIISSIFQKWQRTKKKSLKFLWKNWKEKFLQEIKTD
jgi:signal transduction histidine kinase